MTFQRSNTYDRNWASSLTTSLKSENSNKKKNAGLSPRTVGSRKRGVFTALSCCQLGMSRVYFSVAAPFASGSPRFPLFAVWEGTTGRRRAVLSLAPPAGMPWLPKPACRWRRNKGAPQGRRLRMVASVQAVRCPAYGQSQNEPAATLSSACSARSVQPVLALVAVRFLHARLLNGGAEKWWYFH